MALCNDIAYWKSFHNFPKDRESVENKEAPPMSAPFHLYNPPVPMPLKQRLKPHDYFHGNPTMNDSVMIYFIACYMTQNMPDQYFEY